MAKATDVFLRKRFQMLKATLPGAAEGQVDAVHRARVATRRIGEALPLVTDGAKGRKLRKRVRRLTRALGSVRELDVSIAVLTQLQRKRVLSAQASAHLERALAAERESLQAKMVRRIEHCDVEVLARRAVAATARSGVGRARRSPSSRLTRARARAGRRAERLQAAMDTASSLYLPERLHRVRLAAKKLRYVLEVVDELTRPRHRAHLTTLRSVQDILGRMHDLEVVIARIRDVQRESPVPLRLSGDLDHAVRWLERECRQEHGHYVTLRGALQKTCEAALDTAGRDAVDVA